MFQVIIIFDSIKEQDTDEVKGHNWHGNLLYISSLISKLYSIPNDLPLLKGLITSFVNHEVCKLSHWNPKDAVKLSYHFPP